ncbi:hypothetical protein Rleg10DRAFT_0661 [Rhizobium leguminosarum bv. trifolii WSM2012]|nr:hypothetical protein Rleg10DRAFT_0661 [Rhizobium leguminosarum bv. trifolii WSM2012]
MMPPATVANGPDKWLCRKVEDYWYKISGSGERLDDTPCLFAAGNIHSL